MADDENQKRTPEPETPPTDAADAPEGTPEVTREDAAALPSDVREPREVEVPEEDEKRTDWRHDLRWASSLLLLAILGLSGWNHGPWRARPEGRENLGELVGLILGEQQLVLLLQLVAVLLVVALVGAVVLAIRDPETDETPKGGV